MLKFNIVEHLTTEFDNAHRTVVSAGVVGSVLVLCVVVIDHLECKPTVLSAN
jgi:hypothetical protein